MGNTQDSFLEQQYLYHYMNEREKTNKYLKISYIQSNILKSEDFFKPQKHYSNTECLRKIVKSKPRKVRISKQEYTRNKVQSKLSQPVLKGLSTSKTKLRSSL